MCNVLCGCGVCPDTQHYTLRASRTLYDRRNVNHETKQQHNSKRTNESTKIKSLQREKEVKKKWWNVDAGHGYTKNDKVISISRRRRQTRLESIYRMTFLRNFVEEQILGRDTICPWNWYNFIWNRNHVIWMKQRKRTDRLVHTTYTPNGPERIE